MDICESIDSDYSAGFIGLEGRIWDSDSVHAWQELLFLALGFYSEQSKAHHCGKSLYRASKSWTTVRTDGSSQFDGFCTFLWGRKTLRTWYLRDGTDMLFNGRACSLPKPNIPSLFSWCSQNSKEESIAEAQQSYQHSSRRKTCTIPFWRNNIWLSSLALVNGLKLRCAWRHKLSSNA